MTVNFNRQVSVVVGSLSGGLDLTGQRFEATITKSRIQYPNTAIISIHNLKPSTRQQIKNEFTNIFVQAGYGDNTAIVFSGSIRNAVDRRDGTSIILDVYAGDGDLDYQTAVINTTLEAGAFAQDVLDAIIDTFKEVSLGSALGLDGLEAYRRPVVLNGSSKDELNKFAQTFNLAWSIQDGKLQIAPLATPIPTSFVFSQENGLLASPQVTDVGIEAVLQLTPAILPNRSFRVLSDFRDVQLSNLLYQKRDTDLGGGEHVANTVEHVIDNYGQNFYTTISGIRAFDGQATITD